MSDKICVGRATLVATSNETAIPLWHACITRSRNRLRTLCVDCSVVDSTIRTDFNGLPRPYCLSALGTSDAYHGDPPHPVDPLLQQWPKTLRVCQWTIAVVVARRENRQRGGPLPLLFGGLQRRYSGSAQLQPYNKASSLPLDDSTGCPAIESLTGAQQRTSAEIRRPWRIRRCL
jgi:hypothetical protein